MAINRYHLLRQLLLSGVALSSMAGLASAADMTPVLKAPPQAVAERPWYFQIEGGGAFFNDPTSVDPGSIYGCQPVNCGSPPGYFTETLAGGAGPVVGGRLGYQFWPWFRMDVSLQYMADTLTGNFDWIQFNNGGCNPAVNGPGNCSLNATRKQSALVELVNGYIDLDGVWGMRTGRWHPYLTAGVGAAEDHLGQNCVSCDYGTRNGSNTTTQFAWAAGVGTRIDLFADLKLDVAYRFYDLGRFTGGNNGNLVLNNTGIPRNFTGNDSFRQTVNVITTGLTYPF